MVKTIAIRNPEVISRVAEEIAAGGNKSRDVTEAAEALIIEALGIRTGRRLAMAEGTSSDRPTVNAASTQVD